jgi:DeoR/GlpR family transcriptional regulator of sugar metabolism
MYSAQRRQEILKLIEKADQVNVADLSDHFGVSRATIRRDLNQLHDTGRLQRTYGGALAPGRMAFELPFAERRDVQGAEKARIGEFAAGLVQPGEAIFIDGGTTTECMVSGLTTVPHLTVVTFGLNIVNRLAGHDQITVIMIGGTLHHRSLTFSGTLALDNMQSYGLRFDKAFLAASGVSAQDGITNASLEEIQIKRRAIATAREAILLVDSGKLGAVATGLIVPATGIDRVITGASAPAAEVEALRQLGVSVDLV